MCAYLVASTLTAINIYFRLLNSFNIFLFEFSAVSPLLSGLLGRCQLLARPSSQLLWKICLLKHTNKHMHTTSPRCTRFAGPQLLGRSVGRSVSLFPVFLSLHESNCCSLSYYFRICLSSAYLCVRSFIIY